MEYFTFTLLSDDTYEIKVKDKNNIPEEIVIPIEYEEKEISIVTGFDSCVNLIKVVIPNGIKGVDDSAFEGCTGLTSIEIANSITSIGSSAFYKCTNLTSVNYIGTIDEWVGISFGNFTANPVYCAKELKINGEIVTEAKFTSATKISSYALCNCDSLTLVVISDSVTKIGSYAFQYCSSLISVVIGDSVTSIGYQAFRECAALQSVVIGTSVNSINQYVFYKCSNLKTVKFNDTSTWYRANSQLEWTEKRGTSISVTNSSQIASMLSAVYYAAYWYKL